MVHQGQGSGEIHAVKWANPSRTKTRLVPTVNAVIKILPHQTEGAIIFHLGSCPCNPCNGQCGGSRRNSTSWWRSRWFRSWKRGRQDCTRSGS